MSSIQKALCKVGFQPTPPNREARRKFEQQQMTDALSTVIDEVVAPITKQRKITFTRAGAFVCARYEGRNTAVFVEYPEQAAKKLKFFDGGAKW